MYVVANIPAIYVGNNISCIYLGIFVSGCNPNPWFGDLVNLGGGRGVVISYG